MSNPTEQYVYQPIQDNDGIRLIQLKPSISRDSIISCELIHTRLRTVKQDILEHYTALSYVWGDATQTTVIMVGEQTLEITKSLDSALRHLRDETRVLNLWADGVCINQNDDEGEKGRQVQQMGKVYETADHTVIFLGECDSSTEETLSGVVAQLEENPQDSGTELDQNGKFVTSFLLKRPWFTRVWVYQELVMSRDPMVQCGRVRFSWMLFRDFITRWYSEPPRHNMLRTLQVSPGHIVQQMDQSRWAFLAAHVIPIDAATQQVVDVQSKSANPTYLTKEKRTGYLYLLETLVSRRGFGASDARDLVFSIIGFSRHIDIRADYGLTAAQVYQNFAWNIMGLFGSLEILSYVEDIDLSQRRPGLASWAPDWTIVQHPVRRIRIMSKPNDYVSDTKESSSTETEDATRAYHTIRSLTKCNKLCCKAYRISKIKQISAIIDNLSTEGDSSVDSLLRPINNQSGNSYSESKRPWDTVYYNWWRRWLGSDESILPIERVTTTMKDNTGLPVAGQPTEQYLVERLQHPSRLSILDGRRLARLDTDQLAVIPSSAKVGDHVYLIQGCPVPFVLRRKQRAQEDTTALDAEVSEVRREMTSTSGWVRPRVVHTTLIGECYVDGWMTEPYMDDPWRIASPVVYDKLLVIS
ncbi:hypothetical protein ONS96_002437 [Cadophora gregata f. sp. sojae]|nr:hypothetical protein ONS96_002437 [Cadophora gregata f. sp. sojae]